MKLCEIALISIILLCVVGIPNIMLILAYEPDISWVMLFVVQLISTVIICITTTSIVIDVITG